jgi:flagellar motor protein MotB
LCQYAPAFRDNGIDAEILPKLTADDLAGLGVSSIGDRRKLLAAIAALRGGAASGDVSGRKSWREHLTGLISSSITGFLVLVAALGLPATTEQLDRLSLPTELVTYERALRAGILPAAALVAGGAMLLAIGHALKRLGSWLKEWSRLEGTGSSSFIDFIFLIFVFAYGFWTLVIICFWFIAVSANPLGILDEISKFHQSLFEKHFLIWCLSVMIASLFVVRFLMVFVLGSFIVPFTAFIMAVLTTVLHIQSMREMVLNIRADLDDEVLLYAASIAWGMLNGLITYLVFSMPAFDVGTSIEKKLAWTELFTYGLLFYLLLVETYSNSIYHRLPLIYGGGKPQSVSIWIDTSSSQLNLSQKLPEANCVQEGKQSRCTSAYLVDASGDTWILADSEAPPSRGLAIEKDQIIALSGEIQREPSRDQWADLLRQLKRTSEALADKERQIREQLATIANLTEELEGCHSKFFGRLRQVLGEREDIRVVGDRFVFQSEMLFDEGSAQIGAEGREQLARLADTVREIAEKIPEEIPWVLQVNGHADRRPLRSTLRYYDNWELSTDRAIEVVRFLVERKVPPERLAAAGFGEYQPIYDSNTPEAWARSRRIEFKLTTR